MCALAPGGRISPGFFQWFKMTNAGSLKRRLKQWNRGDRPLVMGVVNVTPDSFSDGGRFHDPEKAIEHALKLPAHVADIVDVGGESTRPGSRGVDEAEELARVMPVIEGIAAACSVPVSIDTSKPAVMRAAVAAGARMVNDINGLRNPDALETVADLNVRSEEHTSELQSRGHLVCRLLLEKKNNIL